MIVRPQRLLTGLLLLMGMLLLPDMARATQIPITDVPWARARDLRVEVATAEPTVSPGGRLGVTVALTNLAKRNVRVTWAWACEPEAAPATSHDSFHFSLLLDGMHREVNACDHSGEAVACRQPRPVFAVLAPGERKEFSWTLDLRPLFEDRAGRLTVRVRYEHGDTNVRVRSKPVAVQVRKPE